MPRPYQGIKQVKLRIHPIVHARIKEVARLRSKVHKCTEGQAMRDALDEGLKRLEAHL